MIQSREESVCCPLRLLRPHAIVLYDDQLVIESWLSGWMGRTTKDNMRTLTGRREMERAAPNTPKHQGREIVKVFDVNFAFTWAPRRRHACAA